MINESSSKTPHELPIKVLLIEDNPYDTELIAEMLAETSSSLFKLTSVQRLSEGIECIAQEAVDMVLLDLSLPDSRGFETFVKFHRQERGHAKSYFQEPTAFEETESAFFAHSEQTFEDIIEMRRPQRKMLYRFTAPMNDDEGNLVGRILVYRDISKEIKIEQINVEVLRLRAELELKYTFQNIIGKSQKMRELYALMQQAIESNITTLILGESGTGKELVAGAATD